MKITEYNPWARSVPAPPSEAVDLTPYGIPAVITLVGLETLSTSAALSEANTLIEEHVGSEEGGEEAVPFLGLDGQEYELNEVIIKDLCLLRHMQPEDERCAFAWWLGLALADPEAYTAISAAAGRLNKRRKAAVEDLSEGNSRPAGAGITRP